MYVQEYYCKFILCLKQAKSAAGFTNITYSWLLVERKFHFQFKYAVQAQWKIM